MPDKKVRGEASRRRILAAATELFFERGFAGTTVDDICARLGVTKPSIYWYYATKTDILDAISLNAGRIVLRSFAESPGDMAPAARLRLGLDSYARNHLEHFKASSIYYRDAPAHSPIAQRQIRAMGDRFYADIVALLDACVTGGAIPAQDTKLTAFGLGGIVGFMYVWYKPGGRLSPVDVAAGMAAVMERTVGFSNTDTVVGAPASRRGGRPASLREAI